MKLLKNIDNVNALMTAVDSCTDSVFLKSADGREEYNLKSALSLFSALATYAGSMVTSTKYSAPTAQMKAIS